MYTVIFTSQARKDLLSLQKKAPKAITKLYKLIDELKEHPRTGTGQLEVLRHQMGKEVYSRRINHEHRLVYTIHDDVVEVHVIAAFGHYN